MHTRIMLVATMMIVPSVYFDFSPQANFAFSNLMASATAEIPIREFAPAIATTNEPLGIVLGLRYLPDGRLLVNDPTHHRLILFDSTLLQYSPVVDSGTATKYGPYSLTLIPYRGDSSLLADGDSRSLLLIDEHARIIRAIAPPKLSDFGAIIGSRVAFDSEGRLYYRGSFPSPKQRFWVIQELS